MDPVAVLHELRTPLTVMVGRVQLLRWRLRRGTDDPAQVLADLDAIAAATARMAGALDALAAGWEPIPGVTGAVEPADLSPR
jgi:signal transduction histidine kinase